MDVAPNTTYGLPADLKSWYLKLSYRIILQITNSFNFNLNCFDSLV